VENNVNVRLFVYFKRVTEFAAYVDAMPCLLRLRDLPSVQSCSTSSGFTNARNERLMSNKNPNDTELTEQLAKMCSAAEAHMKCVSDIVGTQCGRDAMKLIGDIAKREMGISTQFLNNLNISVPDECKTMSVNLNTSTNVTTAAPTTPIKSLANATINNWKTSMLNNGRYERDKVGNDINSTEGRTSGFSMDVSLFSWRSVILNVLCIVLYELADVL